MKLYFKGVYTIIEHDLILFGLSNRPDGTYLITRSERTGVPRIEKIEEEGEAK